MTTLLIGDGEATAHALTAALTLGSEVHILDLPPNVLAEALAQAGRSRGLARGLATGTCVRLLTWLVATIGEKRRRDPLVQPVHWRAGILEGNGVDGGEPPQAVPENHAERIAVAGNGRSMMTGTNTGANDPPRGAD